MLSKLRLDPREQLRPDPLAAKLRIDVNPVDRSDRSPTVDDSALGEADDLALVDGHRHDRVLVRDLVTQFVAVVPPIDGALDQVFVERVPVRLRERGAGDGSDSLDVFGCRIS